MPYSTAGTGSMSLPALSYVSMSSGPISIDSDLTVVGGLTVAGGAGISLTGGGAGFSGASIHVNNALVDATVTAGTQVLVAGATGSASVVATSVHGTANAQFDGTLTVGSSITMNGVITGCIGMHITTANGLVVDGAITGGGTITAGTQVLAGGATGSASVVATSVHGTANAQFDGSLTSGAGGPFSVTSGGAIAAASFHVSSGLVDNTLTVNQLKAAGYAGSASVGGTTLNFSGASTFGSTLTVGTQVLIAGQTGSASIVATSIHGTANAQFDGSLTSGAGGPFSVTSGGAIAAASFHVSTGLVDNTLTAGTQVLVAGQTGSASIVATSIHGTANAQFDGSLTSGAGGPFSVTSGGAITAASIHTSGEGKFGSVQTAGVYASDTATSALGTLYYNNTSYAAYWDSTGLHVAGKLYGNAGTLNIGDHIALGGGNTMSTFAGTFPGTAPGGFPIAQNVGWSNSIVNVLNGMFNALGNCGMW